MGNRQISPSAPAKNRSAFGGVREGSAARMHSDHGYSSLGPARSSGGGFSGGGGQVAAAAVAAAAVVDIDRSENNHGENQFY